MDIRRHYYVNKKTAFSTKQIAIYAVIGALLVGGIAIIANMQGRRGVLQLNPVRMGAAQKGYTAQIQGEGEQTHSAGHWSKYKLSMKFFLIGKDNGTGSGQ